MIHRSIVWVSRYRLAIAWFVLSAIVLVVVALTTGCSSGTVSTVPPPASSSATVPCPKPGDLITDAQLDGCMRGEQLVIIGGHVCADGGRLLADAGVYGFVGQVAKRGGADDPDFAKAYRECVG